MIHEEIPFDKIFGNYSRKVRVDLHNHWRTSSWVKNTDLENATLDATSDDKLGIGGIIGLVNCEDSRYERTIDLARKENPGMFQSIGAENAVYLPAFGDCLVVKGQEVKTRNGDVLFMGLDRDVHILKGVPIPERSLLDALKEGHSLGAIAILPHPFYVDGTLQPGRNPPSRLLMESFVDGYEIHNGSASLAVPFVTPLNANQKAAQAFSRDKGIRETYPSVRAIVTSDGHSFSEIGSSYMEMPMPRDYTTLTTSNRVREALRYGLDAHAKWHMASRSSNSQLSAARHIIDLGILTATSLASKLIPSPLNAPINLVNNKFQDNDYKFPPQMH